MKVEYKFVRKKGSKDVFSMDLTSYVGDANKGFDGSYYLVCPNCRDKHKRGDAGFYLDHHYSKRKLGVVANKSVGHCNRCGSIFVDQTDECRVTIPTWSNPEKVNSNEINIIKLRDIDSIVDKSSDLTSKEVSVLNSRNPFLDPDSLGMKSLRKWHRPNIMTPFYINDELIYYQLRFLDSEFPKYFSPSIRKKPMYIPKGLTDHRNIIICEGVYDALALRYLYPDSMPMAILGSDLTDYQINLIRKYYIPEEVVIFMDDTNLSNKLRDRILSSSLAYYVSDVKVIESEGKDPEEILRELNNLPIKLDIAQLYENNS